MPWRQRFVTTRRHPLAFTGYAITFMLGLTFLIRPFVEHSILISLNPVWRALWIFELISGGLMGMAILSLPPRDEKRWPDLADLIRLEAIAAFVSAAGLFTYAAGIIDIAGWINAAWILVGFLALGMIARAVQARFFDAKKIESLAGLVDEVARQETMRHEKEGE